MGIFGEDPRVEGEIAGHEGRLDAEQAIAGGRRAEAIEGKPLGLRERRRGSQRDGRGDPNA
jgi:hypothetical protein